MSDKELKAIDSKDEKNISGGYGRYRDEEDYSYNYKPNIGPKREWVLLDGDAEFKKEGFFSKKEKRIDNHKEIGVYSTRKEAEEAAKAKGLSLKSVILKMEG